MSTADNLEKLKSAYSEWDSSKGGNTRVWLDMASRDLRLHSLGGDTPALQFAQPHGGELLVSYLEKLLESWDMNYVRPDIFVADGDNIAMFGSASWNYRPNGNTIITPLAHLWQFEDDQAVVFRELFDSALIVKATT